MEEYVKRWFQYVESNLPLVGQPRCTLTTIEQYVVGLEQALDKRGQMLAQSEADINTERAATERAKEAYNSLLAGYERLKASCEPAKRGGGRTEQLQADLSDALRGGPYQVVAALIVEIAREAAKEER